MLLPWLPSAGTNRIRFQGLPGSPGSQLLLGAPRSLRHDCKNSWFRPRMAWGRSKAVLTAAHIYYNTGIGENVTPMANFFGRKK
jgi:hypothetical protein